MDFRMIGCYAQTELGHGSNVQGLETTATYDPKTDEIVMNSPTISSTKWWVGGLGLTATHAVVMAKLHLNGEDYGLHTFLVPIRDKATHKTHEGVEAGDIGPKLGFAGVDNGYVRFTNYRIPRTNMLMKFAQLSDKGEYTVQGGDLIKMVYSTMLFIRKQMVSEAARRLSMGLTIAIRYGIVRRQFKAPGETEETKLLDYQSQQQRLLGLLVDTYAMYFAGVELNARYKQCQLELEAGDSPILGEVNAVASGLKAFFTWETVKGLEVCRQCCGGHGYMSISGVSTMFNDYAPTVTYEGDNTLMAMQCSKWVLKQLNFDKSNGLTPPGPKAQFLWDYENNINLTADSATMDLVRNGEFLGQALKVASIYLALQLRDRLAGETDSDPWNEVVQLDAVQLAKAFCVASVYMDFENEVNKVEDAALQAALVRLKTFYGLRNLLDLTPALIGSGFLTVDHIDLASEALEHLLLEIRPDALGLIEGFNHDDTSLNSAIGCRDGEAYKRMWDWSQLNPINKHKVNPYYEKHFLNPVAKL